MKNSTYINLTNKFKAVKGDDYRHYPISFYKKKVTSELISEWEDFHGESYLDYNGSTLLYLPFAGYMLAFYPQHASEILESMNSLSGEPQSIEQIVIGSGDDKDFYKIREKFFNHLCDYVNLTTVTRGRVLYSLHDYNKKI